MNKKYASKRKHVVFINADRDYREGKAQNYLRAEDLYVILEQQNPEALRAYHKAELDKWLPIVKAANIKLE